MTSRQKASCVDHSTTTTYNHNKALPDMTQLLDTSSNDDLSRYKFTDWKKAWSQQPEEIRWLFHPFLEYSTANAMYSDAGIGKSLVSLELSASIARTEHVLYIDSENRQIDHVERLGDMGYTPEKLTRLWMLSFPDLPPLDTREGGDVLLRLAKKVCAALVVIDTTMRYVEGKENASDTFNEMYKHTMLPLKGAGICSLRLDHEGKDTSKGQRGSSAKRGAEDTVWRLTHPQQGANRWLLIEIDRARHCPEQIRLEIITDPYFGHAWHPDKGYVPSGGLDDRRKLEKAGVTADMTVREAREALKDSGLGMDNKRLSSALMQLRAESVTEQNRT